MTTHETWAKLPTTESLKAHFQPIFDRIAEGSVERERARILPHEPFRWLKEARFGALRVPVELGGFGASVTQLFDLLIDLAAADTNVAQAFRSHLALAEDRLVAPRAEGEPWLKRFAAGEIAGNGWTEIGDVAWGDTITKVTPDADGFRVDGEKYYSTGTLFAEWIDVYATRKDTGAAVIALVASAQPGVTLEDDWRGFGQKLTGTGTTRFDNARVEASAIVPFENRFKYQTAFYQLVLNAVLTGAALAALRDAATVLRGRKRAFSTGSGTLPRHDPQVLQVIGRVRAKAFAARAATLEAARAAQKAYEASRSTDAEAERLANIEAELAAGAAQSVVADLALSATSEIFNALSASSTDSGLALDRHWRNARTAASHNPLIYKERILGDHWVNGVEPAYVWQIGTIPG